MKTPEWPGIATAVGIILIVMIALDLSKWQTLAAALIAFGGGALAYRGAMAKVRQDEAEHRREFLRRQLAIYLKLQIAIARYLPALQELDQTIIVAVANEEAVPVASLRIAEPPEIEEAWDNLDVFPRRLIREIATFRASVRTIDDLLFGLNGHQRIGGSKGSETRLDRVHANVSAISEACTVINNSLEPEIERLAPAIPETDRMFTIYGEPKKK